MENWVEEGSTRVASGKLRKRGCHQNEWCQGLHQAGAVDGSKEKGFVQDAFWK